MRRIFSYIFLLVLSICVLSCKSKDEQILKERENAIWLDLDKEQEVSLYDLFSKVEIFPLETRDSIVLGEPVMEMRVDNGHYYFICAKQQCIWHFNGEGKFVQQINHYGEGPGEYSDISDFRFNRYTNNLEILDPCGQIYVYDHLGNEFKNKILLKREKIRAVHFFIELSPHLYLLFCKARKGNKMLWYDTEKDDVIAETYNLPSFLFFNTAYSNTFTPFYLYNDSVRFVQAFNGDVFSATEKGELVPTYTFDFGEYNFDISTLKEKPIDYYIVHRRTEGAKYANRFIAYGENTKYYMTRFKFHNRIFHLLLDKKSGKVYYFHKLKEDCFCFPLCMDEEALYYVIFPDELPKAINKDVLSLREKQAYEALSLDDNPVVIKYTFK